MEGFSQKIHVEIPLYQCSPNQYDCHHIALNENETLKTKLPTNINDNGVFYLSKQVINDDFFIPESIVNIENGQGYIDIHNASIEDTYVDLTRCPLK